MAGTKSICNFLTIGIDPISTFQEFTDKVGVDLNGAPIEAGFATAIWTWDVMPQQDFDYLLGLVSNGSSAEVTIRTRNNSGASGFDFADYTAIMQRPKAATRIGIVLKNITVEFVTLVLIP